jgi:hypothetical protein
LLAQIVFELFADMMSNINSQASSSLSVELKKRDGQVNLNFFKTCALWQQTEVENNHIRIVRELVKDCAGELFIKDATDASGVVIGRSYHVNFPLMREKRQGANAGKRVTSVRKGRKRELMAEMN